MMKQLIQRTGAVYTDYLTSKNTVLICKKLVGDYFCLCVLMSNMLCYN